MKTAAMLSLTRIFAFCISLIVGGAPCVFPQAKEMRFKKISIEQGLSQSSVYSILQDTLGFMWFGTEDGLNRYDGLHFKHYEHSPYIEGSLSSSTVYGLAEDNDFIWVGTLGGGLNKIQKLTDKITKLRHEPAKANSLSNDFVRCLFKDAQKRLWAGTDSGLDLLLPDGKSFKRFETPAGPAIVYSVVHTPDCGLLAGTSKGLFTIDAQGGKLLPFRYHDGQGEKPLEASVKAVSQDGQGHLWVGTADKGLMVLSIQEGKYVLLESFMIKTGGSGPRSVNALRQDAAGNMWVGAEGEGGGFWDAQKHTYRSLLPEAGKATDHSLDETIIQSFFTDRAGLMWVGTAGGGIKLYDSAAQKFSAFRKEKDNPYSLSNNTTKSVYANDSLAFIGTDAGGINILRRQWGTFSVYKHPDEPVLQTGFVRHMFEDTGGACWLALDGHGVFRFASMVDFLKGTKNYEHFEAGKDDKGLSMNTVRRMFQDKRGDVWIGTSEGGLSVYNGEKKVFTHYNTESPAGKRLSNNTIVSIFEDSEGILWFGTYGGLNRFDPATGVFSAYVKTDGDVGGIGHNLVSCVFGQKGSNLLFCGTYGGGLQVLDKKSGKFYRFTVTDGLPSNVVYGILPDYNGNLWVSTNQGISKISVPIDAASIKKIALKNYDVKDGLQSNEFNGGVYFQDKKGYMFFGGIDGFNIFHPKDIQENRYVPPVSFTSFKVFDREYALDTSILYKNDITLAHDEDFFSFDFVALSFSSPEKNKYQYKLQGFDKEWIDASERRYASYTNLDPGEYTFRARASNSDGLWNETGRSIRVTIVPAFWETLWFRAAVILAVVLLTYSFYKTRLNRIKRQKEVLEIQVKERTHEISLKTEELRGQRDRLVEMNEEINHQKEEISSQRDAVAQKSESLALALGQLAERNEAVTASINYASRIQKAILLSGEALKAELPDSFIFFKPKETVSGDCYWFHKAGGMLFVAAIDCTGHGVPGAFMSLIAHNLMNEIVLSRKIYQPSDILEQMHLGVVAVLHQDENSNKDGMVVGLCRLFENEKAVFAGADSHLVYIRAGELFFEAGNKRSVGGLTGKRESEPFEQTEISLPSRTSFYLFSDGFQDQFGGPDNKKFMKKNLKNLLLKNSGLSFDEQKNAIEIEFTSWKGGRKQTDDVMVIGFGLG